MQSLQSSDRYLYCAQRDKSRFHLNLASFYMFAKRLYIEKMSGNKKTDSWLTRGRDGSILGAERNGQRHIPLASCNAEERKKWESDKYPLRKTVDHTGNRIAENALFLHSMMICISEQTDTDISFHLPTRYSHFF